MSVRGKYLGIPESLVHGKEPNVQCGNSSQLNTTGHGSGGQAEDAVLPGQSGQCQGLAGISHKEGQAGKPQGWGLWITAVNREYIFIASFVQKKTLTSGFLNQTVVPPRSLSPFRLLMVPRVGLFLVTDFCVLTWQKERGS